MKIINPKIQYIMKHFTQVTANGLCTPPCGSSQSKSTRFFFLTLLLGLLTLGSTSAWASTNYFTPGSRIYIHQTDRMLNWGDQMGVIFFYQDEPTKAYGCDCTSEYTKTGTGQNYNSSAAQFCTKISNGYWYFDVPTPDGDKHIGYFRVLKLESGYWCHQQMLICSADEFSGNQNCVTYSQYEVSDNETAAVSEYNSGACVINDNSGSSGSGGGGASLQELSENYCLRGDLWLNSTADNAGWVGAGTTPSPAFTKNEDNTIATLKYVVPAISQGQILSRITLYGNDHSNYKNMSTVWDATNSNVVKDGSSDNEKGKLQVPQQSSFSPKQITLQVTNDGSGEKLKGTISDYTVKKNGWYLYVDEHCVGAMNSNGELIVSDPTYNTQGHHDVFIANSQRDGAISNPSSYWSQGISWFGGLYIDKSSSNVAWSSTQRKYYGDAFSNQAVFPTKGIRNGCGDFKLNSAAEFVKYKFDGGKITINTVSKQQINDTYVLVGDYQGGWNNQDNDHKFSDDHYTKTVSLTLAQNATGVQDKGANGKWFRFKGCKWNDWGTQLNRSNTILLGDDDVIDKNNSLGDEDDRILVKAPYETNVYTFTYFKIDGQNYLQIEVEEASETPHTGDKFYVMGSHNGWCKNCDDHKMTVVDGEYAYKTYENITDNWDFKVAKEDGTELGWSYFSQSKSDYTCTEVPATISNIRPNSYSGAKNLTIYWDGSNVYVHVEDYIAPTTTYTVTIHPNGGSAVNPLSVGEGQTISSISSTYGNGTAKWYKDEELTQEFILGTSTVTSDMHLYAKWGISGNYWLVGDQWMYDTGSSWNNGENPAFTTTDGVATVTFIAPMGRNRFEIIKDNKWGQKINSGSYAAVVNSASPVAISVADGHMEFTLDEMKKVTIIYDGKVSVRAEAYDIHKTGWNIAGNSGLVGQEWNNSACPMDNNGEKILRNINTGNYEFKITPVGSWGIAAVNQFSAANVDKDNSTSNIFRNWTSHLFGSYKDGNEYKLPMNNKKDRNVCIQLTNDMAINGKADIKIAFDGAKITVNVLPKYTVTFNSNEGSEVASQSVFKGAQASEPSAPTKAGYEFVKWQLSGADYSFSSAVTGNITLDAVWAYKAISSVELNESAHTTWLGNSNFVLTPTMTPSDLITKKVEWSSNASGVASVVDGTVHAEGVGTATITCTVTDQFDNVRSATCVVTVAACQMTTDNLYSMTVTGNNTYDGSSATLTDLWDESSDNTEPATFRIVKLKLSNNYYIYDDNGTVKMSTDASLATAQWYEIPTNENFSPNWTGSSFALYEFKNVSTGKYLRRGTQNGGGGDWVYYTTITDSRTTDGNQYKFFYDNTQSTHLVCREGVGTELVKSYMIHNCNLISGLISNYSAYSASPKVPMGTVTDPNGNTYTKLQETVVVDPSYANPNYKASQMNSSYYRMKENATVRANLENALVYGSVITVRLYADAATTVQLTKADGTEIETINLTADAALEYTYTVAYDSELVGETAFVIKAADNHAGIASIEVSRTHAASPDDPALTWDADLSGGVTRSELAGTFQHVASSARSEGAIHYSSSDETVATVTADGTVTPLKAGSTTITATIEAEGCYGEAYIPYNVTLTEPSLQEAIDATAASGTLVLTRDYAEDALIDKAITINGNNHAIGNLTVKTEGDLTLSGALTVNDFSIYGKAGNTTTPAASGQVRNATNLTVNGEAYFLYTVDPNGHVQYGWYDFTVPFRVNVMTGIKGIQEGELNEDFVNERDYAVMEHLGEKQAAGEYAYKKFRGVMEPCRLYSITLDPRNNYNTIRFQKADGDLVAGNEVALNSYSSAVDDKHANWNGVGNGTLHHADAGLSVATIQVYQSGNKTFLPVDRTQYSLVIGSAFMVQETGTMTLNQATHDKLLAPRRAASVQPTAIQIASEGQPFSDQLFISADETAGQGYNQGVDVAKAGNIGNVNVPQIWTNAYNSKLCAHEAQLINGEASYTLSLYAPANGTYTLTSKNIPEGYTLYLTQNGNKIWDMSERYVLDLTKGTATEYGLLLVENYKMPTAIENIGSKADETQKIMRNGILYILRNGKVFNAQGARVK